MSSPPDPSRRPRVVLLVGEPGSGKTTLGRALSDVLRVPFLARDQVRRGLALTAGAWTDRPGPAPSAERAVEAFLQVVEAMAGLGVSCIVEYVVRASRPEDLRRITDVAGCLVVQTTCADAGSRRRARDRQDLLLAHREALSAAGPAETERALAEAEAHMRRVATEMLVEFELPLLRVSTDDGYDPSLPAIVSFVTGASVPC